jgi:ABC-2 type transport system permease protein
MNTIREKLGRNLRIIWTIAAKDVTDALRNKTTLFNIVTVFFIMAMYEWLPSLMYADEADIVVYDAAGSRLVTALEGSPRFELHRVSSIQELKKEMGDDANGELGLVVPADFDQRLASGEEPGLSGYVIWSSRSKATDLASDFERTLEELLGEPVQINIEGTVYPTPDSMGPIRMVSATLVILIIFMATFTVPYLMFEEKRTKTLDALLVSPASIGQVIMGKTLAGLFYCATTAGVVFAFNWAFVVHWGLTIIAVLSGTLLAVGLALLLGIFFENRYQMMIWTLVPGQLLLGAVFLSIVDPILPETLRTAISWIPTVALALVLRYSFADGANSVKVLTRLGVVLASVSLILAIVVWKVRRSDQ